MGDLKEQLAAALPDVEHQLAFYAKGSLHPRYNDKDIPESLKQFCADILPAAPFVDPRKKRISIEKENFPKLIHLEHKTLSKEELRASQIVKSIEDGSFNLDDYSIEDASRISTLFWLPEVITDPDAIYQNGHERIAGDEVYVRVYDKSGPRVKLFFTMDINKRGTLIRTVPVTSFLTDPKKVSNFIAGQPIYRRKTKS
jgi:hypothetical protein